MIEGQPVRKAPTIVAVPMSPAHRAEGMQRVDHVRERHEPFAGRAGCGAGLEARHAQRCYRPRARASSRSAPRAALEFAQIRKAEGRAWIRRANGAAAAPASSRSRSLRDTGPVAFPPAIASGRRSSSARSAAGKCICRARTIARRGPSRRRRRRAPSTPAGSGEGPGEPTGADAPPPGAVDARATRGPRRGADRREPLEGLHPRALRIQHVGSRAGAAFGDRPADLRRSDPERDCGRPHDRARPRHPERLSAAPTPLRPTRNGVDGAPAPR